MRERNRSVDFIKGIAIILVVLGHSIQYGSGNEYISKQLFYDNLIFRFIYSFHMPLFMTVSGWLFFYTRERYLFVTNLVNRFSLFILPIFSWALISALIALKGTKLNGVSNFIGVYVVQCKNLWFLLAVFCCSIMILLIEKYVSGNIYAYIAILLFMLITPDYLYSYLFKYMYPFFLLGFLVNKNYAKHRRKIVALLESKILLLASMLLFMLLLYFYNNDFYIYTTQFSICTNTPFYQLYIDIYRTLIGIIGTGVVTIVGLKICAKYDNWLVKAIIYLGKKTLSIYIISTILFSILADMTGYLQRPEYIFTVLETVIILGMCVGLEWLLNKNRIVYGVLFGVKLKDD